MKKVAIIRRNGLGDFIAGTVPLCNYLVEKYNGNVKFFFFMSSRNIGIARYFFPDASCILIPDGNKYYTHITTALRCRSINPDLGIIPVPEYSKLSSIFMKFLGAQDIYGNTKGSFLARCLINHPCNIYNEKPYEKYHVSLRTLNLIDTSLADVPKKYYPKFIQNNIVDFQLYDTSNNPHVMVELSNNRKASQLSIRKTARIINRLYDSFKFNTLITCKPDDYTEAIALQTLLKSKSECHVTNSLDEFIAYVNKSTYVLAGDGGLGHIAGALGKKLVCLYGVTSVDRWGVLGDNVIHIADPIDVNSISDDRVLDALTYLIKQ